MRVSGLAQSLAHGDLLCVIVAAIIDSMTGRSLDGILRASPWQQSIGMYCTLCLAPASEGMNLQGMVLGLLSLPACLARGI